MTPLIILVLAALGMYGATETQQLTIIVLVGLWACLGIAMRSAEENVDD